MPTEVVSLLAGLSAQEAVLLALMVCGLPASVVLLALSERPIVAGPVRQFAVSTLTALHILQARDRARLVLIGIGLVVLRFCDRGRDQVVTWLLAAARWVEPKKGAGR